MRPYSILLIAVAVMTGAAAPALAQTADDLFDDSTLHDIYIDIHPRDWETLKVEYSENTYYPVIFRWRGLAYEGGGIRSRGFGSRSGVKPGLRVDFNRYEPDRDFLGLKSVILDNSTQDLSFARERIAMQLFRLMGIPSPREAPARLYINNQYAGLYTIVESIDKRFLKRNFNDDDGYLYEYKWIEPYRFEVLGDDPELYSPSMFQPQTHEKDPDPGPIAAMIRTANTAADEDFAAAMSEFLDLPALATHLAVEDFITEWDGLVGDEGMNNFYLYRFAGNNRFRFIPWDKDVILIATDHPIDNKLETNVLTRRLMAVPELADAYYTALQRVAEIAGGAGGWMDQELERIYSQIRGAALTDPNKVCEGTHGAPCNPAFEDEIEWLRVIVRDRAEFVVTSLQDRGLYKSLLPVPASQ